MSMDFEGVKRIVIESIDESKTINELIQIVIDKIYKRGFKDGAENNERIDNQRTQQLG
jgi:hypothetical protein